MPTAHPDRKTNADGGSGAPGPRHARRRRRVRLQGAVLALLLLATLVVALTRGPVLRLVVAGRVQSLAGAELHADAMALDSRGRIIARGLSLRVPGLGGPGGEFLGAARAEVVLDWSGLLTGRVRPVGVRLIDPVFRLSQSRRDGTLNISDLAPTAGRPTGARPPWVDVVRGTVELGEHEGADYTRLAYLPVEGGMRHEPGSSSAYLIRFEQILDAPRPPTAPGGAPTLAGSIDLATGTVALRLVNIELGQVPPTAVPTRYRELWRDLDIRGNIRETAFDYDLRSGFRASLSLDDVAMRVPVPASRQGSDPMNLTSVTGTVTLAPSGVEARLRGDLVDLPCQVDLRTEGLGRDAALRCIVRSESFEVSKNPNLMPYAPEIVRRRFATFSGPTAIVDAQAIITRAAPVAGVPAPFVVGGSIVFRNGAAAYEKLPYPFADMAGRIEFDDTSIRIVNITGRGPTGARLFAEGVIEPPGDGARVELRIDVVDTPIDHVLEYALPERRRALLRSIFSIDAYERLLAERLVVRPSDARAGEPGAPPAFEPGAVAQFGVRVLREQGERTPWSWRAEVHAPTAGLLPEQFPLPIVAEGLRLVVEAEDIALTADVFRPLRGGRGTASATVEVGEPGSPARPRIHVTAEDVPVDDLLLHALPDAGPRADGTPSARSLLTALNLSGPVDCTAHIGPGADGRIAVDASVALAGLSATPAPTDPARTLRLDDIRGDVRLAGGRLRIDGLSAGLTRTDRAGAPAPAGTARLDLDVPTGGDGPVRVAADLAGVDLDAPLEDVVRVAVPTAADTIVRLRAEHRPDGRLDAVVRYARSGDGPGQLELAVPSAERLAFDALGGRVALADVSGTIGFRTSGGVQSAVFDSFGGAVRFNGQDEGRVRVHGRAALGNDAAGGSSDEPIVVRADQARFESPLLHTILEQVVPPRALARYDALEPRGRFDGEVTVRGTAVTGALEPRSLTIRRNGVDIPLALGGRVQFEQDRGRIERVVARTDTFTGVVDGAWRIDPGGAWATDLSFDLEATAFDAALRNLLPGAVGAGVDALDSTIAGPIQVRAGTIAVRQRDPDGPVETRVAAPVDLARADVSVGVRVGADALRVHVDHASGGDEPAGTTLRLGSPSLTVAGVAARHARAVVRIQPDGLVRVTDGTAALHGGRLAVEAVATPTSAGGGRTYGAEVAIAGVRFADLLGALRGGPGAAELGPGPPFVPGPPPAADGLYEEPVPGDASRGWLDGNLSISGVAGEPGTRTGRGTIRIAGGDVMRSPFLMTLVQLSNLQLPLGERPDYLQADFALDGRTVVFDQIALLAPSISILGGGSVSWPDLALDLRFNSRSSRRVPLWTDLVEVLRDELITTVVRGTARDPRFSTQTLAGTRRMLGGMLGQPGPAGAGGPPAGAEARARTERQRFRERPYLMPDERVPPGSQEQR